MSEPNNANPPPATEAMTDERWLREVYQGDRMKQLTPRAVVTGMLLGGVMVLSNLYIGMKTGWGLGVTITSCILAFAIFSSLQKLIPALKNDHFTVLENNMMSSAASAAGYMSSSIFVGAVPALFLVSQQTIHWFPLTLWALSVSMLGVFMAIPMKRQQINVEQLPFPSGIATAETLRALHSEGGEAKSKATALGIGALFGAAAAILRDGAHLLKDKLPFPFSVGFPTATTRIPSHRLTFGLEMSSVLYAAGAIMGIRTGAWMFVASLATYGLLGPFAVEHEWVTAELFRSKWALWPGVGLLVSAGLTTFAMQWRMILRSFAGLGAMFGKSKMPTEHEQRLASIEAPTSWFVWGTLLSGAACVIIGAICFSIAWWMGIIAVLMTFFLALVASRATGETDITPTGAMGKVTQLTFGLLAPSNMTTNLMTASITGGAAIHTADLLTDLKSGYLLGANPRKQVIAQIFGVIAGTLVIVPAYLLLIKPEEIGTDKWPAPAAGQWAGVAQVLAHGVDALPGGALNALVYGGMAGVLLSLLENFVPKHIRKYLPSSTALGLGIILPASNSTAMFVGALVAWFFKKRNAALADRFTVPLASGLVAGESIIAVGIAAATAAGFLH